MLGFRGVFIIFELGLELGLYPSFDALGGIYM